MSAQPANQLHQHIDAASKVSTRAGRQEIASFIRHLFLHAVPQDLEQFSAETLARIAELTFEASCSRAKGQRVVVCEPAPDGRGSFILAVNEDKPFLYDSTMEDLAAAEVTIRAAFHPIITVRRDVKGVRQAFGAEARDATRESFILVFFEEPLERLRELGIEARLNAVFDDVNLAVRDWKAMLGKLEESIAELSKHPPAEASEDDIAESIAFLKWLGHNNFTFLGCRDYVFTGSWEGELRPIGGSGLGLLSDPERRVIRKGAGRTELTPEVRDFLMQPSPLIITKAAVRSSVHRRVHQDYIGVKRFDAEGKLAGERRFVGLFTSTAYQKPASDIPLLRRKVQRVLERSGFPEGGHTHKALVNVLETFPRDELFQIADDEDLYDIAIGILHLHERPQTQLFVRLDKFDRYVSALVFVPRERFSAEVVGRAAQLLAEAYDGHVALVFPQFGDTTVARAHIIITRNSGPRPNPDINELRQAIARAARSWDENFAEALTNLQCPAARALVARYGGTFDGAYRDATTPEEAVSDIAHLESLLAGGADRGEIIVDTYRLPSDSSNCLRAKLFMAHGPAELSACLPVFENFGLRVLEERPYRVTPRVAEVRVPVTIQDFRMELVRPQPLDLAVIKPHFEEAFLKVWSGLSENDGFNRLTLSAALTWREVVVVRAIAKFLRQTGIPFSQAYMEEAVARNADIAAQIVQLFRARFDPEPTRETWRKQCDVLMRRIEGGLADVKSLDDDRILRLFRNAVLAMQRTTFFQRDGEGRPKAELAFKFASRELDELPLPRPLYEVFVYSPRVEGVHLRFGKVARGGLRWSDRREDFRTEVLSLVKAQQVKNAVIVPVGAKGGFYPKQLPVEGTREQVQEEGVAAYKLFVSALLDLTDNIVEHTLVPPPDTVRHDDDDPYLVVAADKGTATFSDIANRLALSRGFWLGDAFASGGSNGYDHKKMGITARGAWEAVKRHFREMGRDIQKEPFTVVGIGDMSGDVFGNGMLLSRHTRLVAAFDHRDIFIDPNPDTEKSYAERQRLFELPRSSWADYNKAAISKGGGVFSRASKVISLSPEMKALTGLSSDKASPPELMRALLKADVDLIWFGGIGTFIKAAAQSHADAGDRTNDSIRVNACDVRAKVIGEGANLGVTQSGRIEYARNGGRINTDAIDNSAGVDTSDHEVNLKILLNAAVSDGDLTREQRDELLAELTEEVARLVLQDNYDQTLALSIASATAPGDLEDHVRMIRDLERRGRLDRSVEGLPSDDDAREMAQQGKGLTRPELAVLLAYAKLSLFDEILAGTLPDDPGIEDLLVAYFPKAVSERFARYLGEHRLRREIIATVLVNILVNAGGPVFVHRIRESSGAEATAVARAFVIAARAYRLGDLRDRINALDGMVSAEVQISMHRDVVELLHRETMWMLRSTAPEQLLSEVVPLYRDGIDSLRGTFSTLVSPVEKQLVESRINELLAAHVPLDLAEDVGVAPLVTAVTDIVRVASETNLPIDAVAGAFFGAGQAAGIDRLRAAAGRISVSAHWDRLALQRIGDDLFTCQRALAAKALSHLDRDAALLKRKDGAEAVNRWAATSQGPLEQARALIADLERSGPFNIAKLTLAVGQLRDLAGV